MIHAKSAFPTAGHFNIQVKIAVTEKEKGNNKPWEKLIKIVEGGMIHRK